MKHFPTRDLLKWVEQEKAGGGGKAMWGALLSDALSDLAELHFRGIVFGPVLAGVSP